MNGLVLLSGIEPTGNRVMRPAVFTVDTFSAGQGQVTVYVEDPEGRREEVKPALNEGKKTYSVTYIPQVMGPHKVCSSASQPVWLKGPLLFTAVFNYPPPHTHNLFTIKWSQINNIRKDISTLIQKEHIKLFKRDRKVIYKVQFPRNADLSIC